VSSSEPPVDASARIAAWRERGDHRLDPVRFHLIEVLAGRAAAHDGPARRILDGKVAALLAAYGEALEAAHGADGAPATKPSAKPPATRGPLAELVEHAARQAPSAAQGPGTSELKTLTYFRSTWSKLSADRRLTQSLAKMPENAGPLNSHHLVHRSLTLMRDLSPEYLNRFMSYVDALLWLDQAGGSRAVVATETARGDSPRKPTRSKAR